MRCEFAMHRKRVAKVCSGGSCLTTQESYTSEEQISTVETEGIVNEVASDYLLCL